MNYRRRWERGAWDLLRTALLLHFLCGVAGDVPAQGREAPPDTTDGVYGKIERFSAKSRFTRWIHSAIFVPPDPVHTEPAPELPARRTNPYERYKGRIVRTILIDVNDPFGHRVEDTVRHATNGMQRLGNSLHIRTRPVIVRNLLLVRPYDRLDPLKVVESERVLRTSPAINDARITVLPVGAGRDSVDLVVRVLDRWSLDVGADGDLGSGNVRATERNLLGLGQELEQRIAMRFEDQLLEFRGHHRVYNIGNSYVSSFINYQLTERLDQVGLNLQRPFFSPLTLWAGGFAMNKTWIRIPYGSIGEGLNYQQMDPFNSDTWLARSFPLQRDGDEAGRVSNIIVGARLATTRYEQRLTPVLDPFGVFRNNTLFLLGVGFSQRQYYKDRYLFRFGLTEDVPEGLLLRFVGGMQKREGLVNMPYLGAELARGRNYSGFGYLGFELGYGTFFQTGDLFDATFRGGLTYFTELTTLGRWHLRQFVRVGTVMGFGKPAYSRINLNVREMYGFESQLASGAHRTIFSFETVAYAPWDLIGFRVAPVLLVGFGLVGEEHQPYLSGQMMQAFTLGLLVRNERLLMNTFEVTLSFYPFIPEEAGSLWRHNAFTNFTTGVRDFNFTNPQIIGYH
jgi:hypothetical protein